MNWINNWIDKYYANKESERLELIEREQEQAHCRTCEMLEKELLIAHQRIEKLLGMLQPMGPKAENNEEVELESIGARFVPWHVKRQQMEQRARRERNLATSKTTEELEKELGIKNG